MKTILFRIRFAIAFSFLLLLPSCFQHKVISKDEDLQSLNYSANSYEIESKGYLKSAVPFTDSLYWSESTRDYLTKSYWVYGKFHFMDRIFYRLENNEFVRITPEEEPKSKKEQNTNTQDYVDLETQSKDAAGVNFYYFRRSNFAIYKRMFDDSGVLGPFETVLDPIKNINQATAIHNTYHSPNKKFALIDLRYSLIGEEEDFTALRFFILNRNTGEIRQHLIKRSDFEGANSLGLEKVAITDEGLVLILGFNKNKEVVESKIQPPSPETAFSSVYRVYRIFQLTKEGEIEEIQLSLEKESHCCPEWNLLDSQHIELYMTKLDREEKVCTDLDLYSIDLENKDLVYPKTLSSKPELREQVREHSPLGGIWKFGQRIEGVSGSFYRIYRNQEFTYDLKGPMSLDKVLIMYFNSDEELQFHKIIPMLGFGTYGLRANNFIQFAQNEGDLLFVHPSKENSAYFEKDKNKMKMNRIISSKGLRLWRITKEGSISQAYYKVGEKFFLSDFSIAEASGFPVAKVEVGIWSKREKELKKAHLMIEFSLLD